MERDRPTVVVTGMGAITPLGQTPELFWENLAAGRSGIGPMTLCDPTNYPCRISGEVSDFDPEQYIEPREARRMARFSQLAVAAGVTAVQSAGLDLSKEDSFPRRRSAGQRQRRVSDAGRKLPHPGPAGRYAHDPILLPHGAAQHGRGQRQPLHWGQGATIPPLPPPAPLPTRPSAKRWPSCAAARPTLCWPAALRPEISQLGLAGFAVMRALSTRNEEPQKASRPFDAGRDGFVPSEGAVILVLETLEHARSRDAAVLAELAGFGCTSDAGHPVQPEGERGSRRPGHGVGAQGRRSGVGTGGLHQRPRHFHAVERRPGKPWLLSGCSAPAPTKFPSVPPSP